MGEQSTTGLPETALSTNRIDLTPVKGAAFVLLVNLIIAGSLASHSLNQHVRSLIDDVSQCAGPVIASIWCISRVVASRTSYRVGPQDIKPTGSSSLLLSSGVLCFGIGQFIWTYYEIVKQVAVPFPSWADAGYLCAYPLLFLGVLTLPTQPLSIFRRGVLLFEGLMLMTGIATFSWYFVTGPTVFQTGESLVARVLGTAYPLADIGLICSVLLVFLRSGKFQITSTGAFLAAGLVSICVSDTVFDYQTLHGTYATGHVVDVGWTFGYMLVAVAARFNLLQKNADQDPMRMTNGSGAMFDNSKMSELRPVISQFVVVLAIAGLVWYSLKTHADHRLQLGVNVGGDIVMVLLLVRQLLMVFENKELTNKLLAFSDSLEAVVQERTRELGAKSDQLIALQTLTSAINETLDAAKVISSAVVHIRSVFNAEGVAIWLCDGTSNEIDLVPKGCNGLNDSAMVIRSAASCGVLQVSHAQKLVESDDRKPDVVWEYLQAPLRSYGVLVGKIGVLRIAEEFSDSELQIIDSIALHLATSLNNAKQYWHARDAADRDPVTNLVNHRAIHEYLDIALELQSYSEEPLSVILADIDNFHMFNDTYGHPIGDEVLRKVANILDSAVKIPGKVGRYRGDEFIIVLPGFTSEECVSFAHSLQSEISQLELHYGEDERTIPTSVSFGIASFPEDSADRQDLMTTANANLKSAKNSDEHIVALSEMQRAHRELRVSSSFRMLDGMVTAVDNKDSYTRLHSEDVTEYALWIADELDLDSDTKQLLRTGGLLHDVGKIGIPDEILRKPGRLDEEEYNVMKQHPTLGALIVGGVSGMDTIVDIVKYHHERWDGNGYPEALIAENIPFNARLVAIADAMSAMTTDRPYRKGMSVTIALQRIEEGIGTQFDPMIAAAFLRIAQTRFTKNGAEYETTILPKAA
jgi:diguanylate cyclase (GGDEF)-like protein/putative nucleotidyltransferase with HDIG domain